MTSRGDWHGVVSEGVTTSLLDPSVIGSGRDLVAWSLERLLVAQIRAPHQHLQKCGNQTAFGGIAGRWLDFSFAITR
jgi:hypothetical protein